MMRRVRSSRRGRGWWPLLSLALVLVVGIIWGLASALAASPAASPSSSSGKVVLKLGWTQEPDNLNVFIGYQAECWEIWALNYDYLFSSGNSNQPVLDLASAFPTQQNGGISPDGKIWTIHIRSDAKFSDGVPVTAADVAFTYNYVIKNNMAQYTLDTAGIEKATALNPTTVQFTCAHPMAIGYMETESIPILPEHIWKHVSCAGGGIKLWQQAADHRQWSLRDGGLGQGQLPEDGQKPLLVGPEAGHRRDLLRDLPERRDHGQRPARRQARRRLGHPGGAVQAAPVGQGHQSDRLPFLQLGRLGDQLLRQANLDGQPRAARLALPQRSELRHRQTAPLRLGLRWSCSARHDHPSSKHVHQSRLPLAAVGRPALHLRLGQGRASCSPRPATRSRTACASTSRASRSSCVSRYRPTRLRSRSRPS